jgi:uncharacterized protein
MNFLLNVALVALCSLASSAWAQLTPEQQAAKDKGLMFYQQYKGISAVPLLRTAAEAGDSEAQYYLAETLRLNAMHITAEAQKWYEAAAEQGEVYAMLRLSGKGDDLCVAMGNCPADMKSPGEWLLLARETAGARAAQGDAEAMKQMNNATAELEWLEKSAEAGYGEGQFWLAVAYRQNEGTFLWPGSREEAVEKWFKASAESGYPPGMMSYADILWKRNDMAGVRHWIEKAAEQGHLETVYSYGSYLAHQPDKVGYPLDLVKGYALVSLVAALDGGGSSPEFAREELPKIAAQMTPEQIKQAEAYANEWQRTHPPLSYFVNKYGF